MIDRNDEPPYPIDAISLLKADHRKVKNLFARYESAGDFTTKHLIAEQVFPELARKTLRLPRCLRRGGMRAFCRGLNSPRPRQGFGVPWRYGPPTHTPPRLPLARP